MWPPAWDAGANPRHNNKKKKKHWCVLHQCAAFVHPLLVMCRVNMVEKGAKYSFQQVDANPRQTPTHPFISFLALQCLLPI